MSYIFSRSDASTWPVLTTITTPSAAEPSSSPALDFIAVIATLELEYYSLSALGMSSTLLERMDEREIGYGGFAIVDRGTIQPNRPVAVKRIRTPAKGRRLDFGSQLHRISLELRILCHESLKRHKNIIDIVGYCLSESFGAGGSPFLALVLEYSSLGDLKGFLKSRRKEFCTRSLIGFAAQVAAGLQALHACRICHGDVKMQNTLVFLHGEDWIVKISDFGESRVARTDDPNMLVQYSLGTPLLNAPEVRSATANSSCTIHEAIQTDVFSFGLLTWEVLKRGSSYFEKAWCSKNEDEVDEYDMQEYLIGLTHDGLLSKACEYFHSRIEDKYLTQSIQEVMDKTLQDSPSERSPMSEVRNCLEVNLESIRQKSLPEKVMAVDALCTWGTRHTVSQLRRAALHNVVIFERSIPFKIQELVLEELRILANSENSSLPVRSHAAMCIAEFYSSGFGVEHDNMQIAAWVLKASELGSLKALAWYPRICRANAITPVDVPYMRPSVDLEQKLSHLDSELYLSGRIRLQVQISVQHLESSLISSQKLTTSDPEQHLAKLGLFSNSTLDDLLPLHVASLLGRNQIIRDLLQHSSVNVASSSGLTAVHFACIGGHLSTLQLLLDEGAEASVTNIQAITPLHLCVFFAAKEAAQAARLLLNRGNEPSALNSERIYWEYHDIELSGTPLDWAVRTRNRALVRALLPFAQSNRSLKIAIACFFWEITADIVEYARTRAQQPENSQDESPDLIGEDAHFGSIHEPFAHWIAHGPDKHNVIGKMLQVCHDYDLLFRRSDPEMSFLGLILSTTQLEDNFALITHSASVYPPEEVKRRNKDGQTALSHALAACKAQEIWRRPLKSIIDLYTVEELESEVYNNFSYLHIAVLEDAVIGARLLLEKGVNVNQWTFGHIDQTALSMCDFKNTTMQSLLLEFGARTDIMDKAGIASLLVNKINQDQAEEGIFQGALGDSHTTVYSEVLHASLRYLIGSTLSDPEADPWTRVSGEVLLDVTLEGAEIEALCRRLENITSDQLEALSLMFDDHQLDSIRNFHTLDLAERQNGLPLTIKVGSQALDNLFGDSMDDLIGEDLTDRILSLYSEFLSTEGQKEGSTIVFEAAKPSIDPDRSHQFREDLYKLQLGTENALTCINDTDKAGMTLIHVASFYVHLSSVVSLLEAGADASISFSIRKGSQILPLQIVCGIGRLYKSLPGTILADLGKHAMAVALELLRWHHSRSDGLFKGVTELHLACRMLMVDEIDEIRSQGCQDKQVGHWPGFEKPVVCQKLAVQLQDDIDVREILEMEGSHKY